MNYFETTLVQETEIKISILDAFMLFGEES